jgi:hypothetical protein
MLIMRNSIRFKTALVLSLLSSLATAQTATNVTCNGCVGTTDIADRTIQASDLAPGAVNSDKITDGTIKPIDLASGAVTSGKIKDGNVAFIDLSPDVQTFLGAAIANISTLGVVGSDTAVAGVVCPSDRIVVSASCLCDNDDGSRNFGVLFACSVAGTGAVAACFDEAGTFNPFLPSPRAEVTAVCVGATSYDGTPWLPLSKGLTSDRIQSQDSKRTSEDLAQWNKQQQDAYEAALSELQNQRAIHGSRLPQRQR